ncbi:MAG: HAMP domain-containing histidine kinase [Bacteroidales bacterium]|nr:HAMP domain-containing histidine kinase [Bacteroidales bacterium]
MLPSLILSYIGLQSIRQEQNRQEELFVQQLENSLALAISRLEADVEDRLSNIINYLPVYNTMPGRIYFDQLRYAINNSPLIDDVFTLGMDYRVYYPRKYLDDRIVQQRLSPAVQVHFDQGVAFEARGMLEAAINQYNEGLKEPGSAFQTLTLMNGIARCQFKMDQLFDARMSFREIIDLDRGRFLGNEVPFVLLAYYQLADIELKLGLPVAAMDIKLDFYELLVENFHQLRFAQHYFYLSKIKEKIEKNLIIFSPAQTRRYLDINRRSRAAENELLFRDFFDNHILPVCRNFFQVHTESTKLEYIRLQVDEDHLIIAMKAVTDESHTKSIKGILLNEAEINNLLISILELHNKEDDTGIFLLNPSETSFKLTADEEDSYLITAGFLNTRDLFPGYSIGINLLDNPDLENIFRRTVRLYYSIFAAIIGVILFGTIFIFRDIYREQQFSRLKSSFISNVSHEIKTPITTIRVLAGNLAEGLIVQQERQNAYFRLINREAEKLSYLTENILDFSSMEARRKVYRKEFISLYDILQKVLRRFYLMHQKDEIVIHDTIPSNLPDVLASPDGIEQAVLNLLDNAAKYSGKSKSIWLSLKQNNKEAVISVLDKGIGIAKDEQQKIFEKFYRVNYTEQKTQGSGIGLSLVKEIALLHKGSIEIESEPGKGSKFSLIIPVNHV